MIAAFRSGTNAILRPFHSSKRHSFTVILVLLAGCGVNLPPKISPISFVSASGASVPPVSSVPVNGQLYLIATVTNDDEALGVSWTVTCGSAVPPGGTSIDTSCGTFDPAQTASGPIPPYPSTGIITTYNAPSAAPKGGSVTITAHATALPSVSSSVTLTIVAAEAILEPGLTLKRREPQVQAATLRTAIPITGVTGKVPSGGL